MGQEITPDKFGRNFAYIKEVDMDQLPPEVRSETGDIERMFAVHDSAGEQLALLADRQLAFHLARENDLVPVIVH